MIFKQKKIEYLKKKLPDTPRYVQWTIPSLLYQARRKNPLVSKGLIINTKGFCTLNGLAHNILHSSYQRAENAQVSLHIHEVWPESLLLEDQDTCKVSKESA